MLQGPETTQKRARALRKQMSLPEVLLWQRLKPRPNGLKFRPQHPAGPYILDFYCHEARLVIEIDGIAHDMGDRPERDEARDADLRQRGLRVVRIPASDVLHDPDEAASAIVAFALGGA
jgi:very-short-patch-repair endonuclease